MSPSSRPFQAPAAPRATLRSLALFAAATVLLAGCHRADPVTDASLSTAVANRLSADSALAGEPIQTSVEGAVVTLNGAVSNEAARELAARDAAQVSGVRTVVNNLSLAVAATTPPAVSVEPASPAPAVAPQDNNRQAERDARRARERQAREAEQARRKQQQQAQQQQQQQQQAANAAAPSPAPVEREAPQAPPPPPAPVVRNVTLPAGTILAVRLSQGLDSGTAQQGQSFSGTLASDVAAEGATVLRQGSNVAGQVTAVQEAAHFKGNALLSIALTSVTRRGDRVPVSTDSYSAEGKGRGKNTVEKVGGGAAIGAILGGIFGGGSGAAIGAAAGGGAGAGVNGLTRGQQVQIPAESVVRFRLSSPVTLRVTEGGQMADQPQPDSGRRPLQ